MWPHPKYPFNLATHVLRPLEAAIEHKSALEFVSSTGRHSMVSRAELRRLVHNAALQLAVQHAPQTCLAIIMDNDLASTVAFLAIMQAGCIAVPLSSQATDPEILHVLDVSDAGALLVASGRSVPNANCRQYLTGDLLTKPQPTPDRALPTTMSEDPAMLIFTSGTSGTPKGVLHAHRMIIGREPMYEGWHGITARDRVMHAGRMNWTYTIGVGFFDPLCVGATAMLARDTSDPAIWSELILTHEVSLFAAAPAIYRRLIKYGDITCLQRSCLTRGVSAGESLPADVIHTWQKETDTRLYQSLGMSEISTYVSFCQTKPPIPDASGYAQPGRHVAILGGAESDAPAATGEIGLLAVHRSDPGLMLGYWRNDSQTGEVCQKDWFAGGDLASMTSDGLIRWAGRHDDIMNISGIRISPLEVETALSLYPEVSECAVVETRNRDGVTLNTAFIVPKSTGTFNEAACRTFMSGQLAGYKCPRRYVLCDGLSRTSNGKIIRRSLRNSI